MPSAAPLRAEQKTMSPISAVEQACDIARVDAVEQRAVSASFYDI